MMNVRKLAALDLAFYGPKFILAEFGLGILLSVALGLFSVTVGFRSHAAWQVAVGGYLILLGINYVPLLFYAIAIVRHKSAHREVAEELAHRDRIVRRYTVPSLLLLVPLVVPVLAIIQEWRKAKEAR
jgi:hypothetical protein